MRDRPILSSPVPIITLEARILAFVLPLLLALLLAFTPRPTPLAAQVEGAERGTAAVTIPAAAVLVGIEERVLEAPAGAPDEGRHIEVQLRVRANTAYRVSAVVAADAPAGVGLAVEGDPDLRELGPGRVWPVATGSGPDERTHRLRIWVPPGPMAGTPVVFRVELLPGS
jgi:hypothetical protein